MKLALLTLYFVIQSFFANASVSYVVECKLMKDNKTNTVRLRMDQNSNLIMWDESHYGQNVSGNFFFYPIGQSNKNSGVESMKSYKALNGYSIMELFTTADSVKIGVNLIAKSGFYEYRDLGSGNGNAGYRLSCESK